MKKKSLSNIILENENFTKDEIFAYILSGRVSVFGQTVKNKNKLFETNIKYKIDKSHKYVSRGGYKIASVIDEFDIQVKDKIILDVGASTGGFTDFCLQNMSSKVITVDSGKNQLAYRLKSHPKVISFESTNIKDVFGFEERPQIALSDLSFRSSCNVVRHIIDMTEEKTLLCLIKPQFELRYIYPNYKFDGVIRDDKIINDILEYVKKYLENENLSVINIVQSKILGTKGNKEFFFLIKDLNFNHTTF